MSYLSSIQAQLTSVFFPQQNETSEVGLKELLVISAKNCFSSVVNTISNRPLASNLRTTLMITVMLVATTKSAEKIVNVATYAFGITTGVALGAIIMGENERTSLRLKENSPKLAEEIFSAAANDVTSKPRSHYIMGGIAIAVTKAVFPAAVERIRNFAACTVLGMGMTFIVASGILIKRVMAEEASQRNERTVEPLLEEQGQVE